MIKKVGDVYHVYQATRIPGRTRLIGKTTSRKKAEELNKRTKKRTK